MTIRRVRSLTGPTYARQSPVWTSESEALEEMFEHLKAMKTADPESHMHAVKIAGIIGQLTSQVKDGVHTNPPSRRAQRFISKKIRKLAHEGYPSPKRVAVAYAMARKAGYRVPKGTTLSRQKRGRRLLGNPLLGVLGMNPPGVERSVAPIEAEWGEIHYVRPDDPDGEVVRVHEFKGGFRAVPLKDGRVILESKNGKRLWTAE